MHHAHGDARRLIKTLHTDALRHNWQAVRRRATARQLLAVVKSDAYGHGLLPVAQTLAPLADGFAVVRQQDALALRHAGITAPIVLLQGAFSTAEMPAIAAHHLTPVVHSQWQVQALAALPADARITVYLKINSGMHRLGFAPQEAAEVQAALAQMPAVAEVVLMTHFANADQPDGVRAALESITPLRTHGQAVSLGNSAATLLHEDIGDDIARIGIALYGASPAPEWQSADALGLQAAMTYSCQLIAVRELQAGEQIGYGGEYTAPRAMTVGIASAGYGDGVPRVKGMTATLAGAPAPLLGRVSMEMIALDLSACPHAAIGDIVTLWGQAPDVHVDDVATAAGTIAYDLLTAAKGELMVQ